jgi:hypothetical protein
MGSARFLQYAMQYVGSFGEREIETRWREETGMWYDVSMSVKISYVTTKFCMLGIYSPHIQDTFTLTRVAVYFLMHLWTSTKLDGVVVVMVMIKQKLPSWSIIKHPVNIYKLYTNVKRVHINGCQSSYTWDRLVTYSFKCIVMNIFMQTKHYSLKH